MSTAPLTTPLEDGEVDLVLDALYHYQAAMRHVRPRSAAEAQRLRQRLLRLQVEAYWDARELEDELAYLPEST